MSEMVERIAESAFKAYWPNDDWARFKGRDYVKEQYRNIARAAIEAMREPTDAMVNAPTSLGGYDSDDHIYEADPMEIWQAMIDEALK